MLKYQSEIEDRMLKHSLKPVTERNLKSRRKSTSDSLVFQFEGATLRTRIDKRRYSLENLLSPTENRLNEKEVLSNCTGPICENMFPFKYFSKTCWTLAEFNLAYPGGIIPSVGAKRLKQLGLFYQHAKVMWNSALINGSSSIDEKYVDKIICFFFVEDYSLIRREYICEQANMLIQKMKTMSRNEIEGFTVYKNCREKHEQQHSLIIEFPLTPGAYGDRFIKELIEFDQEVYGIRVTFGIFQYHGSYL